MLTFLRKHPYILGWLIVVLLLFFIGIFALDVSWSESLFGSVVLSTVGVLGAWWKWEGLG